MANEKTSFLEHLHELLEYNDPLFNKNRCFRLESLGFTLNPENPEILRSLLEQLISSLSSSQIASPVLTNLRYLLVHLGDEWAGPEHPCYTSPVWRTKVLTEELNHPLEDIFISNGIALTILVSRRKASKDISGFHSIYPRLHEQGLLHVDFVTRTYFRS